MKIRLLKPLRLNGIIYRAGLELSIGLDAARRLVRMGFAEAMDVPKPERKTS